MEKKKYVSQEKWQAANMDKIQFRAPKKDRLPERIETASAASCVSKAAYIIDAIKRKLEADEVSE